MNQKFKFFILIISLFVTINNVNAQQDLIVNAKVILSGCYSNGEMRTDLLNKNLIPKSQPFNDTVFNYSGNESVTKVPPNIVDWILVELRIDSTTVVAKKAAFLRKDGQIVGLDGVSNLTFSYVQPGEYYIVIYHRNHLAIMSSSKTFMNDNSILYNFTDSKLKAYGSNSLKDLGDGNFGMIAGDSDQNGIVNILDYGRVADNIFNSAYIPGDLDMSGFVSVMDYSQVYNNILRNKQFPDIITDFTKIYTPSELQDAINLTSEGDVIYISNDIEFLGTPATDSLGILMHSDERLLIQKDISIIGIGDRKPRLFQNKNTLRNHVYLMIEVKSCNVTFNNLIIDGNNYDTENYGGSEPAYAGISVGGLQGTRKWANSSATIDNCNIRGWVYAGVVSANGATVEVKNSYIRHNMKTGLGYGIAIINGSSATIHDCVLDSNRHSVMSDGHPDNVYEVYGNDFYWSLGSYQAVDSHVNFQRAGIDPSVEADDNRASKRITVHDNRFHNWGGHAIAISGIPVEGLYVYDNEFANAWVFDNVGSNAWGQASTDDPISYGTKQAGAIRQYDWVNNGTTFGNVFLDDNTYMAYYDTTFGDLGTVTFDVQYTTNWTRLVAFSRAGGLYPIDSLMFGDFDGDGCTDIVTNYLPSATFISSLDALSSSVLRTVGSDTLWMSSAGLSYWAPLVATSYQMQDLDIADVDGDGTSDLIYNESTWWNGSSWAALPNAFNTYTLYTERDFNGDGKTDSYRINSE